MKTETTKTAAVNTAPEVTPEVKPEVKPEAKKTAPKATPKTLTYKPVSGLADDIAKACWKRKSSNERLAAKLDIGEDKLDDVVKTDEYRQAVFNLMCSQFNEHGFEYWIRTYPNMAVTFNQRMKLNRNGHKAMLAGVRAHHKALANGDEIKVAKPDREIGITLFKSAPRTKKSK